MHSDNCPGETQWPGASGTAQIVTCTTSCFPLWLRGAPSRATQRVCVLPWKDVGSLQVRPLSAMLQPTLCTGFCADRRHFSWVKAPGPSLQAVAASPKKWAESCVLPSEATCLRQGPPKCDQGVSVPVGAPSQAFETTCVYLSLST